MGWMQDESGLDKTAANYAPLTPLSHLRRAALVFADDEAVVYGDHRKTYAEYYDRCTRLASGLAALGVRPGDVVATLIPNLPAQAEAHFGVPACGAVLNTINIRLDVETVAYIFDHGGARVVLVDTQFLELAEATKNQMPGRGRKSSKSRMPRPGSRPAGAIRCTRICWRGPTRNSTGSCHRTNGKAWR